MTIDVTLRVWLKGVDLIERTAYLTLVDKMGYEGKLVAIKRADVYSWEMPSTDPATTVSRLKRVLATGSTFYNKNKHNYLLGCKWNGELDIDGTPFDEVERRLHAEARRHLVEGHPEFDSQQSQDRVILDDVPVFRTEVFVEDIESSAKLALARRLEAELDATPVTVSALGTCWLMALRVGSEDECSTVTDEIVVSQRRDRGLLLNPNDQGFRVLSLQAMDVNA